MRATRRHAADAAAADLTTAYERWSAYINPDIAAHVTAVTGWLRSIPGLEAAAAKADRAEHSATVLASIAKAEDDEADMRALALAAQAATATPEAKAQQERNRAAAAARKPGKVSIRQRLGTEPHAAYPLPDPTEPTDALAGAANLAALSARDVSDKTLAEWAGSPNAEIRTIAGVELSRRAILPAIGDSAVVTPVTKRGMRARGAS